MDKLVVENHSDLCDLNCLRKQPVMNNNIDVEKLLHACKYCKRRKMYVKNINIFGV